MFCPNDHSHIESVPAFYAMNQHGKKQAFIVSIMFFDAQRQPRLTPAVESAINKTIEITGLDCLATANILAEHAGFHLKERLSTLMDKAFRLEKTIVLFLCATPELCEATMKTLNACYKLSMVKYEQSSSLN